MTTPDLIERIQSQLGVDLREEARQHFPDKEVDFVIQGCIVYALVGDEVHMRAMAPGSDTKIQYYPMLEYV